jgi:hypothetical protein
MNVKRPHLGWVRQNIVDQLATVDHFLAEVVPPRTGLPGARGDEPWLVRLFEQRQNLQSTLSEVERQIHRHTA